MAVAFQAAGTAVVTTTTTLALVAPTSSAGDIFLANITSNNNTAITLPQGWKKILEFTNTADQQQTTAWYRASDSDSGATFNFTVGGTTISFGVLTSFRNAVNFGNPIGTSSQSANALSDTVTYATITPRDKFSLIVALGTYNLNATTAGALSGTNPTFTNRVDAETATGNTASLFVYDGLSNDGSDTGSRTHSTTSTVDAINTGVLVELLDFPPGGYAGGSSPVNYPRRDRSQSLGRTF